MFYKNLQQTFAQNNSCLFPGSPNNGPFLHKPPLTWTQKQILPLFTPKQPVSLKQPKEKNRKGENMRPEIPQDMTRRESPPTDAGNRHVNRNMSPLFSLFSRLPLQYPRILSTPGSWGARSQSRLRRPPGLCRIWPSFWGFRQIYRQRESPLCLRCSDCRPKQADSRGFKNVVFVGAWETGRIHGDSKTRFYRWSLKNGSSYLSFRSADLALQTRPLDLL